MKKYTFLLISDIHGNVTAINKLVRSRFKERHLFDAIIIPGDFPSTVPFTLISEYILKNKNFSKIGYSKAVYQGNLRNKFVHHQKNSLSKMVPILKKFNLPILYVPGNTETRELIEHIKIFYPEIHLLDNSIIHFNNEFMIGGLGGSLDHIGSICDFEHSKINFSRKIENFEKKLLTFDPNIPKMLIFHEAPKFLRNKLDIKKSFRKFVISDLHSENSSDLIYFGFSRILQTISSFSPFLVINGHCHEYLGEYIYNNTKIVNPGALAKFYYAIITLNGCNNPKMIKTTFFKIRNFGFSFVNSIYGYNLYSKDPIIVHT